MKNYILALIGFVLLGVTPTFAQQATTWPQEILDQVEQEIDWIDEEVTLSAIQKELLKETLLGYREMQLEEGRMEWKKSLVLSRIENILRFEEIDIFDGQTYTELLSKQDFDAKITNNADLMNRLNLNI